MVDKIYQILLIDSLETHYLRIKELLNKTKFCHFNLTWVKNLDQAMIKRAYCHYDAYLINCQENNLLSWAKKVNPTPVIVLINDSNEININIIKNEISDYLEYQELSTNLLEHCLKLVIKNSKLCQSLENLKYNFSLNLKSLQEQKQNQNEELLNTIFKHSKNGILIIDNMGVVKFANHTAVKLLNKSLDKLINNYFGKVIINDNTTQIEVVNKDNKITTLEMSIAQTKWNKQIASVIIIRDISQEIEREKLLKESEKRYRNLYEKTPAMLHSIDLNGTIINVSDKWLETLGYKKEEVIGKKTLDFLTPKSREYAINICLPTLFDQGFVNNVEYQFVKKNGEIIDILLSAIVQKDEDDNIYGGVGFLQDITEKKRQEQELNKYQEHLEELVLEKTRALQKSEMMFRQMAENINSVFWIAETNKVIYLSPAFEKIWGLTRASVYDDYNIIFTFIHPEDRTVFINNIEHQKAGEFTNIEYRIINPQGEIRWLNTRTFPIYNEDGKLIRFAGISDDITERKKWEQELKAAKEKYENILKYTYEGFWLVDIVNDPGKILEVNDAYCKVIGYSREELLTMSLNDLDVIETSEMITQRMQKIITQGWDYFETKHRCKNGKIIDILASANYIPETGYCYSFITDITEKKQLELALKESEQKYVNLVEGVQVGLYINDPQGNCIFINKKCQELLAINFAECAGTGWSDRIHPEDKERMLKHWQECFETKSPWEDEYRFVHPNGRIVWVYAQAVFPFNKKGENIGSIGSLTNITERKKLEEELAESQRIFNDLAANVPGAIFRYILHHDGTDEVIYMSDGCEYIWEYTAQEIAKNTSLVWELIHPEDVSKMVDSIKISAQNLTPWFLEYRITTPSGQKKWLQGAGKPKLEPNGDVIWNSLIVDITDRKKAEISLQKSEIRYRNLVESLPAIIYSYCTKHGGMYYSPQVEFVLGYTLKELKENPLLWHNSIHEDDQEMVNQSILNCVKGEKFNLEYRIKDKYNKWHWFYDCCITYSIENNYIIIDGIAIDITERKEMEIALKESEENLKLAQKIAHIGNWKYKIKEQQNYWSDEVYHIFGKNQKDFQLSPENFLNCIHPEDQLKVKNLFNQMLINKKAEKTNYRIIGPDQKIKYIQEYTNLILDDQGEISEIIGTIQDITELKEKELALIESEQRFRAIFEQAAVGIVTISTSGKILSFNEKYRQLTGYSKTELLGKYFGEITHYDDINKCVESIKDLIDNKYSNYSVEKRFIRPDNTIQWVNATVSLVKNYQENNDYCVAIVEDINERKKAENELNYRLQIQTILAFISQELANQNDLDLLPILGLIGYNFQASRVCINCLHDQGKKFSIISEWCHPYVSSIKDKLQNVPVQSFPWWLKNLQNDRHIIILNLNDFPLEAIREKSFFIGAKISFVIYVPIFANNGKLWGFIGFDCVEQQPDFSYEQAEIDAQMLRIVGEMIYSYFSRQEAKKALQESESHYRAIVEDQTELICRFSPEGKLTFVNNAYGRYFNIKPEELIGKNWLDLIYSKKQKQHQQIIQKINQLTPDDPILLNEEKLIIQGKIRWQQWTNRAIFNDEGKIIEIQGLGQDITERKQAEDALKQSEAKFKGIFNQVGVGIALVDIKGNFLDCNPSFLSFFSYKNADIFNVNFIDLIHEDDRLITKEYIKNILEQKNNYFNLEKRYLTANDQIKWGNLSVTLVTNNQNKPFYFIFVLEDIQKRKETEINLQKAKQSAEEANLAKSQFLANMSHELRTPLNAILGFTQLMEQSNQLIANHREYLEIINRAGEHLLSLINDILDLSKIESGKIELINQTFDLSNLLDNIEKILQIKVKAKNLKLIFQNYCPQKLTITTDQNKLRSVLINLLSNAIKFTKNGTVKLTVKTLEKTEQKINLLFEIEDTGVGIKEEEIGNLFDIFVQSDSGKKSGEGSGLGLAICKRFVNLMGGEIHVKSKLNQGSIFSFNIVAKISLFSSPSLVKNKQKIIGINSSKKPQILIVEDNNINRKLLSKLLEEIGFKIQECANGKEAINLWQTWQPDLILMDMRMPVMNGYQAIKIIRKWEKKYQVTQPIKIIAVSASALAQEQLTIIKTGCDDFIPKPVQPDELYSKIAIHLNLSYLYQCSESLNQVSLISQKIKPQDLLLMPIDWRKNLHKAALAARSNNILQLIDEIPREYENMIESLKELVKQLNFEELISLTEISESNDDI